MLGVLTTMDFVASKPQSSPANTYLPPDQGYQYQRPSVPFPSPVPGPSGPPPTYPRPSPGPLRPSPTPTYGPPPSVPQGPPRPPPTYGGGQVSSRLHATHTSPLFLAMSLRTDIYVIRDIYTDIYISNIVECCIPYTEWWHCTVRKNWRLNCFSLSNFVEEKLFIFYITVDTFACYCSY
jgi:hypothetical protein